MSEIAKTMSVGKPNDLGNCAYFLSRNNNKTMLDKYVSYMYDVTKDLYQFASSSLEANIKQISSCLTNQNLIMKEIFMSSKTISREQLVRFIDHTMVNANATIRDIDKLCKEAIDNNFAMIAVSPCMVSYCADKLKGTDVAVGVGAVSFPHGRATIETKVFETKDAIKNGAQEIEYVMNIGACKEHDYDLIRKEMREINNVCKKHGVLVKAILETCYLTNEEMIEVAKIAREEKPDFLKTSTGFASAGARVEHVKLLLENVGPDVFVKAAGEIRDWETCAAMIDAGATRIGTRSSIKIMDEFDKARQQL